MTNYVPTIGLEIHAELRTSSKMFCSCKNNPDEDIPNKNVCPICLGHPGTLPVLNMEAIKKVLQIGIALEANLATFTEWDRKNYFYPDIPKGYQISQFLYPLISGGMLDGVSIERIHLEEDTAQSTHDLHEKSLVNFNRSGVPLMELVTKPVIHDALTAVSFAKELQLLLRTLGAGDANMEKGEMRVEANISVASREETAEGKFGTKTEIKNLNSFRAVERAIAYEIERQSALLIGGGKVVQETRGWDDHKNETYSQRSKESSHDYRYFPDPDIAKLNLKDIPQFSHESLKASLPELPWIKRDRYKNDFGMTDKESAVFVESPDTSTYFEKIIAPFISDKKKIRLSTNYFLTDYLGLLKKTGKDLNSVSPRHFSELIELVSSNSLSSKGTKEILSILVENSETIKEAGVGNTNDKEQIASIEELARLKGLLQKSDASLLEPAIDKVISDNPQVVTEFKNGKTASLQFLIGQAMKATKGAGNPTIVREILIKKLT